MTRPPRLTITETEPVPLLRDFKTFIDYIKENQIALTKVNSHITKADVFKLNMLMTSQETKPTKNSDQLAYPLLNFFYHLVLSGRLFIKTTSKGGKKVLEPDDRLKLYEALTLTEKYFFLLETFWTDINWINAGEFYIKDFTYIYEVPVLVAYLSSIKPGQRFDLTRTDRLSTEYLFMKFSYINLYLSYLGFIEVTPNEKMISEINRRLFFPASVVPTAFGVLMADILTRYRHLPLWNLPFRKYEGEFKVVPGTPLPEDSAYREMMFVIKDAVLRGDKPKLLVPTRQSKTSEPFFKPFVSYFAEDELQKTLPRLENIFNDGTYEFKIYLNKKTWRRIETAARHTLEDLHLAIQDAFDFQDDHLYSFFMDGIVWSKERISCPEEDEGPYSNEVRIGELSLYKGQSILYLFDYGDMWKFDVVLEGIYTDRPLPFKPMLIEKYGPSYDQYYQCDE